MDQFRTNQTGHVQVPPGTRDKKLEEDSPQW